MRIGWNGDLLLFLCSSTTCADLCQQPKAQSEEITSVALLPNKLPVVETPIMAPGECRM